jgi:hypothetical protein
MSNKGCRHYFGLVYHEQIRTPEQLGQVCEPTVPDAAGASFDCEEPGPVSPLCGVLRDE